MRTLVDYGAIKEVVSPDGNQLQLLPTCTVLSEHLMEENWDPHCRVINQGNYRRVRRVTRLADQTPVGLFAKGPERVLRRDRDALLRGEVWWHGSRSGEKGIHYSNHPLVEEQVVWEAIFLLELVRVGLPAEVPQAIVTFPCGQKELLVKEVERVALGERDVPAVGLDLNGLRSAARALGFIPDDLGSHNVISNKEGRLTIIDVNRWLWPPITDERYSQIVSFLMRNAV